MGVGRREYEDFAEFVTAATLSLSRAAFLLTGDHQLAEDLLQSALAHAYRHWRRISGGNPYAYVRRAMYNEQASWWRRRRVREHLSAEPDRGDPGRDDPTDGLALRLTVERALAVLTPRQRAVVVLRFYEDLTEAETARVLGCAVGTVKRCGHEALARLREVAPHLIDQADAPDPGAEVTP